jgi:hypothetical protein
MEMNFNQSIEKNIIDARRKVKELIARGEAKECEKKKLVNKYETSRKRAEYRDKAQKEKQYKLTIARDTAAKNVTYGYDEVSLSEHMRNSEQMRSTINAISNFDNLKILELLNEYHEKRENNTDSVDYYFELIHFYQTLKGIKKLGIKAGSNFNRKIKSLRKKSNPALPNPLSFYIKNISLNNQDDNGLTLGLNKNDLETAIKEITKEVLSTYTYNTKSLASQNDFNKFDEKVLSIMRGLVKRN